MWHANKYIAHYLPRLAHTHTRNEPERYMDMTKKQRLHGVLVACLVSSVALNLYLVLKAQKQPQQNLSWSQRAAAEAESVGDISCSGHGRAYIDGSGVGSAECECNTCYGGPNCSHFHPTCPANADGGDPLFLEPFWMQHAASSAVLVAGWHRMSYNYHGGSFKSKELELHIRKLHAVVGNAVTEGRYIVFGTGSIQLLNAAVHALAARNSSTSPAPARVVASIPFYPVYQHQTEFFQSVDFKFLGDAALWKNTSDTAEAIEFVTSPNNPDGQLNKAVLHAPNVKPIYDHAYYWPHFTAIPTPADGDLMTFSLSKLSGHAGSRFGWAVIKNEEIYQTMMTYVNVNTMGVSRESQLRTLKLLKVVLADGGRSVFEFGYNTMRKRWQQLSNILSLTKRFSLQNIPPQYCTFFSKVREASPAYAWLKCEREEEMDCYEVLRAANITGRRGSLFSAEERYVRLSLIRNQDDFDILLDKLNKLVAEEDGRKSM